MLRQLANFANLFQAYRDAVDGAGGFVAGQAASMVGIFNPQEGEDGNSDVLDAITLALGVVAAGLSLGSAPAFATGGTAVGLMLSVLPLFEVEAE